MTATFVSNDNARDLDTLDAQIQEEQQANESNSLLASLIGEQSDKSTFAYGTTYNPLPPNDYAPNRPGGGNVPIGSEAAHVSNYFGVKFNRGWLSGAGGPHIDQALGSCAFAVRPAPYNNNVAAAFRAVVPEYGAPVAGLANWDVGAPGRQTAAENYLNARAEFIPSTFDSRLNGLDITSGNVGPRVFTADQGIIKAPTQQFDPFLQVPEGGNALPISAGFDSIAFGSRANPNVWKATSAIGLSGTKRLGGAGLKMGPTGGIYD